MGPRVNKNSLFEVLKLSDQLLLTFLHFPFSNHALRVYVAPLALSASSAPTTSCPYLPFSFPSPFSNWQRLSKLYVIAIRLSWSFFFFFINCSLKREVEKWFIGGCIKFWWGLHCNLNWHLGASVCMSPPNGVRIYVPHRIVGGMNRFMYYVATTHS